MIITRVTAVALKGRNFSYALAPAQAIIGPNFTGKTAVIEAIRLCLMGSLPEVGKLPKATWELSSAAEMTVSLDFDQGLPGSLTRRFWLEGSTVKTEMRFGQGALPIGTNGFENLPLLDAARYFGMTDSERTAYVFSMIKLPDSFTPTAIVAECERLSFEEAHSEQVQKAKAVFIARIGRHFEPPLSIQDGLSSAIDDLRENFTHWNKRAKDTQGAVTTMAELKLRETTVVAAAQGVGELIEKAHTAIEELKSKKGKLEAQQEEAERAATRVSVIAKLLAAPVRDYAAAIENLRARADTIVLEPTVLEKGARANTVEAIRIAKDDRAQLYGRVMEQERILKTANEQAEQLEELPCCPYCKSKGKDWRATLAGQLEATISKATAEHSTAKSMMEKLDKRLEEMETTLAASDDAMRKNANRQLDKDTCARQIEALERDKASDDARRVELQEELATLKKRPVADDLGAEIQVLNTDITSARIKLAGLEEKQTAETQLKQDLRRAAEAELEHLSAKAHVLVIKAIANLLKEKREAMITEAFTGLLETANKVAGGILKAPLALHENTVGMWSGAKFIPHRVFSGTERALCYIAIAVALSSAAPLRLAILDEFGRLDEENQYKVLLRMAILVEEGVIDQFIVVGTSLPKQIETSNVHLEVIRLK